MIEVRCCHELAEVEPLRDEINALNLRSARPDPFSTFEFYEHILRDAAWRLPGAGLRLWMLLVFDDGRLAGYLALKQRFEKVLGVRYAKLELLTAFVASRPHAVIQRGLEKTVISAIYDYLLGRKQEWSLLEFHQQDDQSALVPPPPEAGSGSFRLQHWPTLPNGTIPVCWKTLDAYFSALSKKARSNLSRQMRTLMAAGDVQVMSSSDPRALPSLFELYLAIESHSWKGNTSAAISGNRHWQSYFAGLKEPGQRMQMSILILLLDGVPIGGLICGAFGKGLYALNIVYDDRFSRLAPGSAVLMLGMRQAIACGCEFFDLLSGFSYYKTRWLAQMSETRSLQIYHRGSLLYWKRKLGDARRRWLGSGAGEPALSSAPDHSIAGDAVEAAAPVPQTAQEREHYAALIAQARQGAVEFLTSEAVSAAMPFPTQRRIEHTDAGGRRRSSVQLDHGNPALVRAFT